MTPVQVKNFWIKLMAKQKSEQHILPQETVADTMIDAILVEVAEIRKELNEIKKQMETV